MKAFRRLCIIIAALFVIITATVNFFFFITEDTSEGVYRIEAKRIADDIRSSGSYDISSYPHITGVYTDEDGPIYSSNNHYIIYEINGRLYRIEYSVKKSYKSILALNGMLAVIFVIIYAALFYIRQHILKPFSRLNNVPKELAKGNLSVPIPEEKSRFFGKFTWGVNLLRESIEDSRKKEMEMQRDKKVLMLSLSHDIKTPLSAIKLNAQALSKGLYKEENRQREAAESINTRATEIENFVKQITQAASEDFMNFEVELKEEFLSHITDKIYARYSAQLIQTDTEFIIDKFEDCILSCDPDRLGECLQNLVENAIKYGDRRHIRLSFDKMDGCELITVSNTGCTLDPFELTHIFSSFHRGSNAENVNGNGLGLFICKKLMALMNGEVYAEVRDECFYATLVVRLA